MKKGFNPFRAWEKQSSSESSNAEEAARAKMTEGEIQPEEKETSKVSEAGENQSGGLSAAERIVELEEELAQTKDQVLRRTAEMENMRRRFQQEREILIFEGNKRLITDLLPTIDDLERTLGQTNADNKALREGVDLVLKNLKKELDRYNVQEIETIGKQFDVHAMDALMEMESADTTPGTVLQEVQKGYTINDTVLRHAKVIVAKAPDNGK